MNQTITTSLSSNVFEKLDIEWLLMETLQAAWMVKKLRKTLS